MITDLEMGDALADPNDRTLTHVLISRLCTAPESAAIIRGAMARSNVPELKALLDALKITDQKGMGSAEGSMMSHANSKQETGFTPFRATVADLDNINAVQDHLNVRHVSDAIRAALTLYAALIRGGVFSPDDLGDSL